jgi:hypothetical protein
VPDAGDDLLTGSASRTTSRNIGNHYPFVLDRLFSSIGYDRFYSSGEMTAISASTTGRSTAGMSDEFTTTKTRSAGGEEKGKLKKISGDRVGLRRPALHLLSQVKRYVYYVDNDPAFRATIGGVKCWIGDIGTDRSWRRPGDGAAETDTG